MKIQQGDVLLTAISPAEFAKAQKEKNVERTGWYSNDTRNTATIALGEATGHHHSITDGLGSAETFQTPYRSYLNQEDIGTLKSNYLKVNNHKNHKEYNNVVMTHQEHNPVTIPPGYYKISLVREFDHMSQLSRLVVD